VVRAPYTSFSNLWNFFASSFHFSLTYTNFSVSASTICVVIFSCINDALSKCAYSMFVFSSSSYAIICATFSWRGSNWACLSCLFVYVVFKSVCRVFISWVPFNHLVILMILYHLFNSYMVVLIFSSCWSNCWNFSSSSKMVQICAIMLNSFVTSLASFCISTIWSAD
jgi:hypothetical protein